MLVAILLIVSCVTFEGDKRRRLNVAGKKDTVRIKHEDEVQNYPNLHPSTNSIKLLSNTKHWILKILII